MPEKIKWNIDPSHSRINFKIRHLMISYVGGSFSVFDADIVTQGNDFTTAEIDFWIDPASVSTGDEKRDAHLRGDEFFGVEKYKQITFRAVSIEKKDVDEFELEGELTIKGITRRVKLTVSYGGTVKDPWGKERAGFTLSGKVNRQDWNLNWNSPLENGGVLVGNEVMINCDIELVRAGGEVEKMELREAESDEIASEE